MVGLTFGEWLSVVVPGIAFLHWFIGMVFGRCLPIPWFRCQYCERRGNHRGKHIWKEGFYKRTLPGRDGTFD